MIPKSSHNITSQLDPDLYKEQDGDPVLGEMRSLSNWIHRSTLKKKQNTDPTVKKNRIRLKKGFSLLVLILVTCVSTIGVLRSLVIISFLRDDGRLKNLGSGDEKIGILKENVWFLVLKKSGGGGHLPLRPLVPPALFLLQLLSVGVFFCHFGNCLSTHFVTRLLR